MPDSYQGECISSGAAEAIADARNAEPWHEKQELRLSGGGDGVNGCMSEEDGLLGPNYIGL